MVIRGRAPWVSGARSVVRAWVAVVIRASQRRAPWSRGSTSSSPVSGSRAGAGAVSGSSAVRRVAASSTVPRPRTRTPPAPSSVIERYRPRWAARSPFSSSFSASRSARSGSATASRCFAALARSVALSRVASSRSRASARPRSSGLCGSRSIASAITAACSGETRPARSAAWVAGSSVDQLAGLAHGAVPGRAVGAGQVGEPLGGGAPAEVGLGDLAGVDLGQHRGLDRGQPAAQRLQLLDRPDQLLGGPRRPQQLVQPGQPGARVGDHPGRGERCRREVLHDPTQPEPTDSHGLLTWGYLTI